MHAVHADADNTLDTQAPTRAKPAVRRAADLSSGFSGGNQARLRRLSATAPRVQCKLTIGAVDDPLEVEADRVADHVMRMPDPVSKIGGRALSPASGLPRIRRACAHCDEQDTRVQKKNDSTSDSQASDATDVLRRRCSACEEQPLMRQAAGESTDAAPSALENVASIVGGGGQPLDGAVRGHFEPRFQRNFDQVRVHTDSAAARSAQDVGALAYTVGSHVVFAPGQYAPQSAGGAHLLAHELAHVAQNGEGAKAPEGAVRRVKHGSSTPTNCHNWTIPLPPWIAGTAAHAQIATRLGILPHSIPRATKLLKGISSPPAITPFGFADLWSPHAADTEMAEIKSTATGGVVAADEAKHYKIRHDESVTRSVGGIGDSRDSDYMKAVGGPLPGAPLDLSSITGSDLIIGNFVPDPAKLLHMEGDAAGAVVYWCTGTGMIGSPIWLPVLKAALDALAKKLQAAKKALREAAGKLGAAVAVAARFVVSLLLPLLVALMVIAIVALLIVAIICLIGSPETFGLTLACSYLAVEAAGAAAVAALALFGLSAPKLPAALGNVFRASNPETAAAEPESGADYDRDPGPGGPPTAAGTAGAAPAYNPGDELTASLTPITDQLADPIGFMTTVGKNVSLSSASVGTLNSAVVALDSSGDSVTSAFLRGAIQSSGLDQPGATASATPTPDGQAQAVAQAGADPAAASSPTSTATPAGQTGTPA